MTARVLLIDSAEGSALSSVLLNSQRDCPALVGGGKKSQGAVSSLGESYSRKNSLCPAICIGLRLHYVFF